MQKAIYPETLAPKKIDMKKKQTSYVLIDHYVASRCFW